MSKIAVLYICTGKYFTFLESFFNYAEKNLFPGSEKRYFVFTEKGRKCILKDRFPDKIELVEMANEDATKWPLVTLMRYKFFHCCESELMKYDYCIFCNANLYWINEVSEEMLLPKKGSNKIRFQWHPYYTTVSTPQELPYDRTEGSTARVGYDEGRYYIAGGLLAGETKPFLDMSKDLEKKIDEDFNKGIIAKFHDESHINRWIIDNPDKFELLPPPFMWPSEFGTTKKTYGTTDFKTIYGYCLNKKVLGSGEDHQNIRNKNEYDIDIRYNDALVHRWYDLKINGEIVGMLKIRYNICIVGTTGQTGVVVGEDEKSLSVVWDDTGLETFTKDETNHLLTSSQRQ